MKNRYATPSITIPRTCPKCQGFILPDISWQHGKIVKGYKCFNCGLTGESEEFIDMIHNKRRPTRGKG